MVEARPTEVIYWQSTREACAQKSRCFSDLWEVAGSTGLEPATSGVTGSTK